jgi:hypothetical protein
VNNGFLRDFVGAEVVMVKSPNVHDISVVLCTSELCFGIEHDGTQQILQVCGDGIRFAKTQEVSAPEAACMTPSSSEQTRLDVSDVCVKCTSLGKWKEEQSQYRGGVKTTCDASVGFRAVLASSVDCHITSVDNAYLGFCDVVVLDLGFHLNDVPISMLHIFEDGESSLFWDSVVDTEMPLDMIGDTPNPSSMILSHTSLRITYDRSEACEQASKLLVHIPRVDVDITPVQLRILSDACDLLDIGGGENTSGGGGGLMEAMEMEVEVDISEINLTLGKWCDLSRSTLKQSQFFTIVQCHVFGTTLSGTLQEELVHCRGAARSFAVYDGLQARSAVFCPIIRCLHRESKAGDAIAFTFKRSVDEAGEMRMELDRLLVNWNPHTIAHIWDFFKSARPSSWQNPNPCQDTMKSPQDCRRLRTTIKVDIGSELSINFNKEDVEMADKDGQIVSVGGYTLINMSSTSASVEVCLFYSPGDMCVRGSLPMCTLTDHVSLETIFPEIMRPTDSRSRVMFSFQTFFPPSAPDVAHATDWNDWTLQSSPLCVNQEGHVEYEQEDHNSLLGKSDTLLEIDFSNVEFVYYHQYWSELIDYLFWGIIGNEVLGSDEVEGLVARHRLAHRFRNIVVTVPCTLQKDDGMTATIKDIGVVNHFSHFSHVPCTAGTNSGKELASAWRQQTLRQRGKFGVEKQEEANMDGLFWSNGLRWGSDDVWMNSFDISLQGVQLFCIRKSAGASIMEIPANVSIRWEYMLGVEAACPSWALELNASCGTSETRERCVVHVNEQQYCETLLNVIFQNIGADVIQPSSSSKRRHHPREQGRLREEGSGLHSRPAPLFHYEYELDLPGAPFQAGLQFGPCAVIMAQERKDCNGELAVLPIMSLESSNLCVDFIRDVTVAVVPTGEDGGDGGGAGRQSEDFHAIVTLFDVSVVSWSAADDCFYEIIRGEHGPRRSNNDDIFGENTAKEQHQSQSPLSSKGKGPLVTNAGLRRLEEILVGEGGVNVQLMDDMAFSHPSSHHHHQGVVQVVHHFGEAEDGSDTVSDILCCNARVLAIPAAFETAARFPWTESLDGGDTAGLAFPGFETEAQMSVNYQCEGVCIVLPNDTNAKLDSAQQLLVLCGSAKGMYRFETESMDTFSAIKENSDHLLFGDLAVSVRDGQFLAYDAPGTSGCGAFHFCDNHDHSLLFCKHAVQTHTPCLNLAAISCFYLHPALGLN